jgi:hypothetical protein
MMQGKLYIVMQCNLNVINVMSWILSRQQKNQGEEKWYIS